MKRCLVVDDSKVIRKVARHLLETLDFRITEAGDGREALAALHEDAPDVILLDWNMPVMGGIEFLGELKRLDMANRPKVVFCTTENAPSSIRDAISAGADEYIMKPFDRETLKSKLEIVGLG